MGWSVLPPCRQLSLFNVQAVTAWREGRGGRTVGASVEQWGGAGGGELYRCLAASADRAARCMLMIYVSPLLRPDGLQRGRRGIQALVTTAQDSC